MTDKRHKPGKKRSTGAGAEGAEGIHSLADEKASDERSGVERVHGGDKPGSEPLEQRERNPKGSYGGEGGKPRKPPAEA